jgi:hypothetical protein
VLALARQEPERQFHWHVNLGTPFTPSCADLTPVVGITGTPVIDLSSSTLYVDTKLAAGPSQKLHALDITTGSEKFGGPVTIAASGFSASLQHQRPGLLLLNGVVYVAFGSHCDQGSYHGFVLGYNATNLSRVAAFNVTSTGSQGSVWSGGMAPAADSTGNIYIMMIAETVPGTSFIRSLGDTGCLAMWQCTHSIGSEAVNGRLPGKA